MAIVELKSLIYTILVNNGGGIKLVDLMHELFIKYGENFHHINDVDIPNKIISEIKLDESIKILEYHSHVGLKFKKYFIYLKVDD